MAASLTLDARVVANVGSLRLDAALTATRGETVAVVGPNGAGKTTLLRALAGLQPLADGRIELSGRVLDDARRGVRVPPEQRRVGFVFQDYVLFPHMTALENVSFGLRLPAAQARDRAEEWLEAVGVAAHAGSHPAALSGGQAQRVALARALAREPELLLLDEPLAAVDAETRTHLRRELRRHLDAFEGVALVVTHDVDDATVLANRVVTIEGGRLSA